MNPVIAASACIFLLCGAVADLRSRKIPNSLNVGAFIVGVTLSCFFAGLEGLSYSMGGFIVGLTILFVPFSAGLIGGGDVKFAAAAGTFLGWQLLLAGLAGGIILGGVVGVATLVSQGRLNRALKSLKLDLYSMASGIRPMTLKETANVKTIPYGVMLAIGMAGALAAETWRLVSWVDL